QSSLPCAAGEGRGGGTLLRHAASRRRPPPNLPPLRRGRGKGAGLSSLPCGAGEGWGGGTGGVQRCGSAVRPSVSPPPRATGGVGAGLGCSVAVVPCPPPRLPTLRRGRGHGRPRWGRGGGLLRRLRMRRLCRRGRGIGCVICMRWRGGGLLVPGLRRCVVMIGA